MPKKHIVKQGECLSSIAAHYGFLDWRKLYDSPDNAPLRAKRPDPNVLMPGDEIVIPDSNAKSVSVPTGQAHQFRAERRPVSLKLDVRGWDGKALAGKKYRLDVASERWEETIPSDGVIVKPVPPEVTFGKLTVWREPDDEITWELAIGSLDPVGTVSGIQARLNNLGYDCPIDGKEGPRTRCAVRGFQTAHDLKIDGIAGPRTQAALKKAHGC